MKVVFADFDGVFHPTTDIVGIDLPTLALHGAEALLATGLFRWTHLLERALADTEVVLVVHSTWRRASWANALIRDLLGPLGHRFLSCTRGEVGREDSIAEFVERTGVKEFIILDDADTEFEELTEHLICTDPLQGVSDPGVLDNIRAWATARSRTDLCVPMP